MSNRERFPDELDLRKLNRKNWQTLGPFRYWTALLGNGALTCITVPTGEKTDLTSVPAPARGYVSRDGEHTKAAIIHDHLYNVSSIPAFPHMTRRLADAIFLEAMEVRGIRKWKRRIIWAAVRAGGWLSFRKERRND